MNLLLRLPTSQKSTTIRFPRSGFLLQPQCSKLTLPLCFKSFIQLLHLKSYCRQTSRLCLLLCMFFPSILPKVYIYFLTGSIWAEHNRNWAFLNTMEGLNRNRVRSQSIASENVKYSSIKPRFPSVNPFSSGCPLVSGFRYSLEIPSLHFLSFLSPPFVHNPVRPLILRRRRTSALMFLKRRMPRNVRQLRWREHEVSWLQWHGNFHFDSTSRGGSKFLDFDVAFAASSELLYSQSCMYELLQLPRYSFCSWLSRAPDSGNRGNFTENLWRTAQESDLLGNTSLKLLLE